MPTPNQTAQYRPISFILHNTDDGSAPVERRLIVRPEELTRSDVSRIQTHQTLGGAFSDNFGKGLPTVNISGITGWGQGSLPNGQLEFEALHKLIYVDWHTARNKLAKAGKDPDLVKLIFNDALDNFTWVVACNSFILKRSKSRPLLSQYQIALTYVSDDVSDSLEKSKKALALKKGTVLTALASYLKKINDFVAMMRQRIADFFGPFREGIMLLSQITASVLFAYQSLVTGGILHELNNISSLLVTSLFNVMQTITSIQNLPSDVMYSIGGFSSALLSVYCIMSNHLVPQMTLPNYDDVYGASICSSTTGGRPLSKYQEVNTFEAITPETASKVYVTGEASAALTSLSKMDVALHPQSLETIGNLSTIAANGIMVAA